MPGGPTNGVSSIRGRSQVSHQRGAIVDGAPRDLAKGRRSGRRKDRTPSLRQGSDADDASKPGRCWHQSAGTITVNAAGMTETTIGVLPTTVPSTSTSRLGVVSTRTSRAWARKA